MFGIAIRGERFTFYKKKGKKHPSSFSGMARLRSQEGNVQT